MKCDCGAQLERLGNGHLHCDPCKWTSKFCYPLTIRELHPDVWHQVDVVSMPVIDIVRSVR